MLLPHGLTECETDLRLIRLSPVSGFQTILLLGIECKGGSDVDEGVGAARRLSFWWSAFGKIYKLSSIDCLFSRMKNFVGKSASSVSIA